MARKSNVMKIFCRNSLILKTDASRLCPKVLSPVFTSAVADAMENPSNQESRNLKQGKGKRQERTRWPLRFPGRFSCIHPQSMVWRGFILFFTGFFGGATSSATPPLALILSSADFEK